MSLSIFEVPAPQPMSAVAGILDKDGGLRVVVTQKGRLRFHVGENERLFVVPDLRVREPVPFKEIPELIETVQKYVSSKVAPNNKCGECQVCCITPYIKNEQFIKPAGAKCTNCAGGGCKIYYGRPQGCQDFKCLWLASQERNDRMSAELRPDRCGVMLTDDTVNGDPLVFEVHPAHWRASESSSAEVKAYIDEMQRMGYRAKLITHYEEPSK